MADFGRLGSQAEAQMQGGEPVPDMIGGDAGSELASNRTSLSFERTRMGADRTLMSTVRTSLSLISFGFTIHSVFAKGANIIQGANVTGRNLGLALLVMGVVLLVTGIMAHARFDRALIARRDRLHGMGLLRTPADYHATPTYLIAIALLVAGLAALGSIAWRMMR